MRGDYDAVRQLRAMGIDPFSKSGMLQTVANENATYALGQVERVQLPQTVAQAPAPAQYAPPPPQQTEYVEDPALKRSREIRKMQRDIVSRRRKRLFLLIARLGFFVGLPTILAGIYFYTMATPLYATKSSFLIQTNEVAPAAPGGGLGGLLGSGGLNLTDSVTVQEFLLSHEAMMRLDTEQGFKAHFQSTAIDALSRLPDNATNEDMFKVYQRNVKIGYDPTEGLIKLEVIAASPQASEDFSKALISYAEDHVDKQSLRLREDQMQGAREAFREAELARAEALNRLVKLQRDLEVLSGESEIARIQSQIAQLETEMNGYKLQLELQKQNRRPNRAKVDSLERSIDLRQQQIDELNAQLTRSVNGEISVADKNAQLRIAEADYMTRDLMLQTALQSLETARVNADRQVRYLAPTVSPVAPDSPTYPRKFENTVLASLIFGGIYLMMSLTASILKEQV